jgi:glutaconate CoA-transferase subunit B
VTVEQVRAETGWPLHVAADLVFTAPPSTIELETLRGMRTVGEKETS